MPLQNRVLPTGEIVADSARGSLMGNRGVLHNANKEVLRQYRNKPWITCALEYKGRKRELMSPNMYTELFFLDEVTAFAAGHRPCAECRRPRFNEFRDAWASILWDGEGKPRAGEMDAVLHAERIKGSGEKVTWSAEWESLPVGAAFLYEGVTFAMHPTGPLLWTSKGYQPVLQGLPADAVVEVFTPRSVVALFANGFVPEFHSSATQQ